MLWLLALVYGFVVRIRNLKYDKLGIAAKYKLKVISIGNLGVGGTGKTPLGIKCALQAQSKNIKVAVLLRGYGSKDGVSDEAELYKRALGEEHVYINPNRRESLSVIEAKGYDLALMDDAFQHRKVDRDIDLIVMDAKHSVLEDSLIPLGMLREPIVGLSRAHVMVITRCESISSESLKKMTQSILDKFNHLKIYEARTMVKAVNPTCLGYEWENNYNVYLFSGIGDPTKFRDTAIREGVNIVGESIFRDHHFLSDQECSEMLLSAKAVGADCFLTTEKDAVKINRKLGLPLFELGIDLEINSSEELFLGLFEGLEVN